MIRDLLKRLRFFDDVECDEALARAKGVQRGERGVFFFSPPERNRTDGRRKAGKWSSSYSEQLEPALARVRVEASRVAARARARIGVRVRVSGRVGARTKLYHTVHCNVVLHNPLISVKYCLQST